MTVTSQKLKLKSVHVKSIEEELNSFAATWEEANYVLQQWAISILKNGFIGDTEEVEITVNFEDSRPYQFRVNLKHIHFIEVDLATELMNELKFMAGDRSYNMTQQEYLDYLRKWEINTSEYKSLISTWDIPV